MHVNISPHRIIVSNTLASDWAGATVVVSKKDSFIRLLK